MSKRVKLPPMPTFVMKPLPPVYRGPAVAAGRETTNVTDYLCHRCNTVLATRVTPEQITGTAFICWKCGAHSGLLRAPSLQ
ncbi:hypothetical protein [uncultured Pigmentiphaga sp.]|uniref:hypothetical protein n=1 Tax=uncultured Pigmentiphaga sp. TaxID=340361 RepID=UPI00261C8C6D|nr:hypothetical protein [uncultured Pigmentiphaga sp.]